MNIINNEDKEVIEELFEVNEYDAYYLFKPITDSSFIQDKFELHPLKIQKDSEYSISKQLEQYIDDLTFINEDYFETNKEHEYSEEVFMAKVFLLNVAMLADYLDGIVDVDYLTEFDETMQEILEDYFANGKKKGISLVS